MLNFKNVLLAIFFCIAIVVILPRSEQLVSLFTTADAPVVLHADEKGHFFGNLSINGTVFKYIVDSGASHVTLNSHDANKAKIDYTKGRLVSLVTPSGELQAFTIQLNGLMIGAVVLNDVETTVVEGAFPPYVLLGISAQNKLDVKRDNSVMTLGWK